MTGILFSPIRTCNGAREWISDNTIDPSPEYECASYGQDQYRTFDGRWIVFHQERCEFTMMEGDGVKISVKNEPCRYVVLLESGSQTRVRDIRELTLVN